MIIKPGHQNIDIEGGVFFSYLSDWSVGSTLVELVALLASLFSMDPPVYAKPPGYNPPPQQPRRYPPPNQVQPRSAYGANESVADAYRRASYENNSSMYGQNVVTGVVNPSYDSNKSSPVYAAVNSCTPPPSATPIAAAVTQNGYGATNYPTATAMPSNGSYPSSSGNYSAMTATATAVGASAGGAVYASQNSNSKSNLSPNASATSVSALSSTFSPPNNFTKQQRSTLENELLNKLKKELKDYFYKLKSEVDDELSTKWALQNSANEMNEILKTYESSRVKLYEATRDVEGKMASLEAWRLGMESKKDQDAENYALPYDELSVQIIRLQSDVLAVDDAIYYLEKGLANSVIDLPTFLKETRNLARTQFLAKNHLLKINAAIAQGTAPASAMSK
jgi:hypothetical protein